jgi:hypothetical protein
MSVRVLKTNERSNELTSGRASKSVVNPLDVRHPPRLSQPSGAATRPVPFAGSGRESAQIIFTPRLSLRHQQLRYSKLTARRTPPRCEKCWAHKSMRPDNDFLPLAKRGARGVVVAHQTQNSDLARFAPVDRLGFVRAVCAFARAEQANLRVSDLVFLPAIGQLRFVRALSALATTKHPNSRISDLVLLPAVRPARVRSRSFGARHHKVAQLSDVGSDPFSGRRAGSGSFAQFRGFTTAQQHSFRKVEFGSLSGRTASSDSKDETRGMCTSPSM